MNYLRNGGENKKKIELLVSLSSMTSDGIKAGLSDYFHRGFSESDAAALNGVLQPNLKKSINRLNEIAGIVELIKDIDWSKFKSAN